MIDLTAAAASGDVMGRTQCSNTRSGDAQEGLARVEGSTGQPCAGPGAGSRGLSRRPIHHTMSTVAVGSATRRLNHHNTVLMQPAGTQTQAPPAAETRAEPEMRRQRLARCTYDGHGVNKYVHTSSVGSIWAFKRSLTSSMCIYGSGTLMGCFWKSTELK